MSCVGDARKVRPARAAGLLPRLIVDAAVGARACQGASLFLVVGCVHVWWYRSQLGPVGLQLVGGRTVVVPPLAASGGFFFSRSASSCADVRTYSSDAARGWSLLTLFERTAHAADNAFPAGSPIYI